MVTYKCWKCDYPLVGGTCDNGCPPANEVPQVTVSAQDWEGPQTIDEARCFDSGFKAGLTTYAREKGDSTLKSGNELLRRLMDEQGWKTIETFEKLQAKAGEESLMLAMMLTPEDDTAAYDADPSDPLSDAEINSLVRTVTDYDRAMEVLDDIERDMTHSDDADATLNAMVSRIQEFRTLMNARPPSCEHGIEEGEFCEACREDYRTARFDFDNGTDEIQ